MKIVQVYPGHDLWQFFLNTPDALNVQGFTSGPRNTNALEKLFQPQHRFFERGAAACFVALEDTKVVGRIAAFTDAKLHQNSENQANSSREKTGSFGCFECSNSTTAAGLLLDAAKKWLRSQGMSVMVGPVDFTIFHEYRVMSSGFETIPYPGEPRTPAHYRELLEKCGMSVASTWRSYEMNRQDHKTQFESLEKELEVYQQSHAQYHIEPFEKSMLASELKSLYPLIMDTFADNFGSTELSIEEFLDLYEPLLPLVCTRSSFKLLHEEKLAGFSLCYLNPFQPNSVVWHSIGTTAEHRGKGLLYLMAWKGFKTFYELGYELSIGSLIKDGPNFYQRTKQATRTYQVFSCRLKPELKPSGLKPELKPSGLKPELRP